MWASRELCYGTESNFLFGLSIFILLKKIGIEEDCKTILGQKDFKSLGKILLNSKYCNNQVVVGASFAKA